MGWLFSNFCKGFDMSEMRASFKRDLGEVCWRELRIHLQRDSIVLVSGELDLIELLLPLPKMTNRRLNSGFPLD